MAETTSTNYGLSASTRAAVAKAGSGELAEASRHLIKGEAASLAGIAVEGLRDKIVAGKERVEGAIEKWDAGFDSMESRGGWASGDLFDQFQQMEMGNRNAYIEAIKDKDKGAQRRLLKDQGSRSSALQSWKKTMESAKAINDQPGGGWSEIMKSEPPSEEQQIMLAMSKMDGATSQVRMEGDEMVFDLTLQNEETRTVTRREVDDIAAKGVKPSQLENAWMETILAAEQAGPQGHSFGNFNVRREQNASKIANDVIPSMMTEPFGGQIFSDHIISHPDIINAFQDLNLTYTTTVPAFEDGKPIPDSAVSPTDPTSDGGVNVTEEEAKNFNKEDLKLIVAEMAKENNVDIARGYLADWMTKIQQRANTDGGKSYQDKMWQQRYNNSGKDEQEMMMWEKSLEDGRGVDWGPGTNMTYSQWIALNPKPVKK